MSSNGDIVIIRNGRSTSQVSIYNYPEHLNPFYEDDHHKRIRFWRFSEGDWGNAGRRFSLNILKNMWAFRSFRLNRKSSSLGVNKTSESPTIIRRHMNSSRDSLNIQNSNIETYFKGYKNFQRNAFYRSSLQDMKNMEQNHFGGDNIRRSYSTLTQLGHFECSSAHQSRKNFTERSASSEISLKNSNLQKGLHLRLPEKLMVSANPFLSGEDDDELVHKENHPETTKEVRRKKEKAPVPPTPKHICDNKVTDPNDNDNMANILTKINILTMNASREIKDDVEKIENKKGEATNIQTSISLESNGHVAPISKNIESLAMNMNGRMKDVLEKQGNTKVHAPNIEPVMNNENANFTTSTALETNRPATIILNNGETSKDTRIECIKLEFGRPSSNAMPTNVSSFQSTSPYQDRNANELNKNNTIRSNFSSSLNNPIISKNLMKMINNDNDTSSEKLVIVEDRDHKNFPNGSVEITDHSSHNLQINFVAYRCRSNNDSDWRKFTLAPLQGHVPQEKRKSVKEIIESINKSQKLLKTDFAPLQKLDDSNHNSKKPVVMTALSTFPNNLEIRESLKIENENANNDVENSLNSTESSTLGWNPLPKPKRVIIE